MTIEMLEGGKFCIRYQKGGLNHFMKCDCWVSKEAVLGMFLKERWELEILLEDCILQREILCVPKLSGKRKRPHEYPLFKGTKGDWEGRGLNFGVRRLGGPA